MPQQNHLQRVAVAQEAAGEVAKAEGRGGQLRNVVGDILVLAPQRHKVKQLQGVGRGMALRSRKVGPADGVSACRLLLTTAHGRPRRAQRRLPSAAPLNQP